MSQSTIKVTLEENEVKPIFERLAKLRSEVGTIPESFLVAPEGEEGDSLFGDPLFEGAGEPSAVRELHESDGSDGETQEEEQVEPTAVPFTGCFDPNRYFDVFDVLRLESGHRLDYVYEFLGNSGQPLLYTRRDERRIQSPHEYAEQFPDSFTHRSRITWPNRLHEAQGEKLVAYDCGITY